MSYGTASLPVNAFCAICQRETAHGSLSGLCTEHEDFTDYDEGPTCSICDALGHGYPGGGPCPLEETGYWEARADERFL